MTISPTFIARTILGVLFFISCTQTASAATVPQTYTDFIRTKCSVTTYPSLCIQTLSPYAASVKTNPLDLCNTALNVAIQGTKNASSSVTKLISQEGILRTEAAVIKECISDLKDTIYELKDTLNAMEHLGDRDRDFQWSNAKTKASAAITDAETCNDGISERKVSAALKKKITSYISGVKKVISNALSLINHLY